MTYGTFDLWHYGQSAYAVPLLEQDFVDNLSGLSSIGDIVFYRSSDRVAPHNAYASAKGIDEGIKRMDYDTKYSPKLSAYNIQSGETIYLKINKGKYYADPERVISKEDIIRVVTESKNKKRKTDKGWETLDETEEWIAQYKIV